MEAWQRTFLKTSHVALSGPFISPWFIVCGVGWSFPVACFRLGLLSLLLLLLLLQLPPALCAVGCCTVQACSANPRLKMRRRIRPPWCRTFWTTKTHDCKKNWCARLMGNQFGSRRFLATFCVNVSQSVSAQEAHLKKIRSLFTQLGADNTGSITYDMLKHHIRTPAVRVYFESLGLNVTDAWSFFKLLDVDGGIWEDPKRAAVNYWHYLCCVNLAQTITTCVYVKTCNIVLFGRVELCMVCVCCGALPMSIWCGPCRGLCCCCRWRSRYWRIFVGLPPFARTSSSYGHCKAELRPTVVDQEPREVSCSAKVDNLKLWSQRFM